jgi:hypothetical protein
MNDVFDPLNLDNRVSLNRTRFANDERIDQVLRGQEAWSLLSSRVMAEVVKARAAHLRLGPDDFENTDALALLDRCLSRTDWEVAAVARSLAERFGRDLSDLLSTLVCLGPAGDGLWPAYTEYWRSIKTVVLGGGVMRGELGEVMRRACFARLLENGCARLAMGGSRYSQVLPLIGAGRSVEGGSTWALVFDFGSTNVKRGVARYQDGALTALRVKTPLPTNGLPDEISGTSDMAVAHRLADFMTRIIVEDWRAAVATGESPSNHIAASIACYLHDGQPLPYGAGHASLRLLSDNAATYLSRSVSVAVDAPVRVELSHDGTTAARVFAGQPNTAVIMMGTWLGVGFAPEDASAFRPLAPDFTVSNVP